MKNKIIALTLSAIIALSSTSAFAAEVTKFEGNYQNYDSLKNYINVIINGKLNVKSIKVNGKTVDLNSIYLTDTEAKAPVEKPATAPTVAPKPVAKQAPVPAPTPAPVPAATPAPVPAPTPAPTPVSVKTPATTNNTNTSVLSYEQKVVELVNVERQKSGLQALTLDTEISNVARTKSKDMADNNYFAHQSPTYGSAGDMLTKFGIRWSAWGENLASGQRTPESVVTAWMNSEGHRANIMSSSFSRIGVGYVTNSTGTPYWTQVFTD